MSLSIDDKELQMMHQLGVVSKCKDYDGWFAEFCEKLPSYKEGELHFTFVAARSGRIRYVDAVMKDNPYIPEILPKIHYIDHSRKIEEIQRDIFNKEQLDSVFLTTTDQLDIMNKIKLKSITQEEITQYLK